MPLIDPSELPRLLASGSSVAGPTILTCVGVAALFLLSELVARRTVVYRRNTEGAVFSLVLAAAGFYALGYLGLLTFIIGILIGAWVWISRIKAAHERLIGTRDAAVHY